MNPKSWWLLFGIFLFSLLLGSLIGLSSSPVLGTTITAGLGIIVAYIGLFNQRKGTSPNTDTLQLDYIGKILVLSSIGIILGVTCGVVMRTHTAKFLRPSVSFPWQEGKEPAEAREALDWVVVHHKLSVMGYADSQIRSIYKIRQEQIESSIANGNHQYSYDPEKPYHMTISEELPQSEQPRVIVERNPGEFMPPWGVDSVFVPFKSF